MRRITVIITLALIPFVFSACGGASSDEDQIKDAVDQIATAKEQNEIEEVCDNLFTPAFLQEVYGGERAQCLKKPLNEEDEFEDQGETTVASVDIDSDSAFASVKIETVGGDTDGVNGTWKMLKDGGDWKLDRIQDDYLRSEFTKATQLVDGGMIAYEPMRKCFLSKIPDLDSKPLRAITFGEASGDKKASFEAGNKIAESCPHALDLYVAQSLADKVLSKKKVSDKVTKCAQKKLVFLLDVTGLSEDTLKQNNRFGDSTSVAIATLIASAVRDCRGLPPLQ